MREPESFILSWMDDERNADGWELRMVRLLRGMAGEEAIEALKATDFRRRAHRQAREQLLDRIADRIEQEIGDEQLAAWIADEGDEEL